MTPPSRRWFPEVCFFRLTTTLSRLLTNYSFLNIALSDLRPTEATFQEMTYSPENSRDASLRGIPSKLELLFDDQPYDGRLCCSSHQCS